MVSITWKAGPRRPGVGRQVDGDQRVVDEVGADAGQVRARPAGRARAAARPARSRCAAGSPGCRKLPAARTTVSASTTLAVRSRTPRARPPRDLDPVDQGVGADLEVRSLPGRRQVGQGGAHPDAVADVAGQRAHADRAGPVVVVDRRVAARDRRRRRTRAGTRRARRDAAAATGIGPSVPCHSSGKSGSVSAGAEQRKQLVERPAGVAGGGPRVVVRGPAAHPEGAVRRGAAADQAGPRQRIGGPGSVGLGEVVPVVTQGGAGAVGDVGRQVPGGG